MRTESMIPKPKRTDAQSTSLLKLLKPADLLSILNALFGLAAIVSVLDGTSVTERALEHALILILLAVVADCLDGAVARKMGSSPIGKYLDSLADMISFGAAPAIVAYVLGLSESYFTVTSTYRDIVLTFCGAYVICGMLRLARFDANHTLTGDAAPNERNADFEGFPITGSATFLAAIMLLILELRLSSSSAVLILMVLMGLLCLLMTSRIRYRTLRDKRITIPAGLVFLTLFVLYICSLKFVYPAIAVAALTAFYICSPFLYKKRENFM